MNNYIKYSIYLIILIIVYFYLTTNNNLELNSHFVNRSDNSYGSELFKVPLNIYHTWNTRRIPYKMNQNIKYILKENPEFDYYLFDDNECREYIKNNFSEDVLEAFDMLIPGAYKADLWRCCIMYKKGGVYMDIKLKPLIKLTKLIEMNNFYFVKDTPSMINCDYKIGIYNAFMISYPNNIIFKLCIEEIVKNCKNEYYGLNSLAVTGPCLLGNIFNDYFNNEYESFIDLYLNKDDNCIYNKDNIKIVDTYYGYRDEQIKLGSVHYSILWNQKKIFNLIKNVNKIDKIDKIDKINKVNIIDKIDKINKIKNKIY